MAGDLVLGWVGSPTTRGTRDLLYSCLSTIWLCTWTCLCLNILPADGPRPSIRSLLYKLRWQLFAVLFPEVLVATAAEQWLSARQSVGAFAKLGHPEWTIRHGFYADMGGVLIAPPDWRPFPVDSQQLAFLVQHKYISMPEISTEDLTSLNKAGELARLVTAAQMTWFSISSALRCVNGLGISSMEATTLAFILCTLHNFFFWYLKPKDPCARRTVLLNTHIRKIWLRSGLDANEYITTYRDTPLDFVKPPQDPKSLTAPFWLGLAALTNYGKNGIVRPAQRLSNSRVKPQDGLNWALTAYILFFQVAFYGLHIAFAWLAAFPSTIERELWIFSNVASFRLIAIYVVGIPIGTLAAPFLGRWLFDTKANSITDLVAKLPRWAEILIHGPFILAYVLARLIVLVESTVSLRALPSTLYTTSNWSAVLPHF